MKRTLWNIGAIFITITFLCSTVTFLLSNHIFDDFRHDAIQSFAEDSREELEGELIDVRQDLLLWSVEYQNRMVEPDGARVDQPFDLAVLPAGTKYDLVALVDSCGRIQSFRAGDERAAKRKILGDDYRKYFAPAAGGTDWLRPIFDGQSDQETLGWQEFRAIDELFDRREKTDVPEQDVDGRQRRDARAEMHQFALAVPINLPQAGCPGKIGFAVTAVVRWTPFQEILDRVEDRLKSYSFDSGYAYLIDADDSTVIGHRNAEVYGTRLQTLFPTNPGLVVFQNAIQRHVDGFVNYQYPGSTQKTAFLTRVRNIGNRQAPGQLAWTLGVGVNQQDVARLARQGAARFLLPNLLISLMGVAAYWWYIRRFHVSFSDLIDMVKRARTIDEIDTGQVAGREQRYSELIESVADLIVRSRSDSTFIPVQNRYIVGTPLRGAEMFFGREDELRWINDHLQEPGNSIVLFAGQRRIGKTSLLHQTAARVRDIIPVFIDTQALIPTLYTDKDFFVQIGNAVCEQVKTLSGNGGKINAGTLRPVTGPSELAALIAQLSATGRRVVLLIDEMENLDLKFRRGELSPSPLLWLAGQIEDQYPFSVVTTGSSELPQDGDGWDKLAAKVILRKVSYLIHDEAERLVRTPVRGYVSFNQGTVEGMLRFTGCHPYYTQDFCHRLITHINQTHHYDIDSDDIDNISEDMVRNAPNAIDHAWSQFVAPKQAAAAAVAGALETVTEFASPAEALKLVPPDVRKECFSRDVDFQLTLNELLAEEYLERGEDGYRFRCDLWRRWVNEYHPLEV